MLTKAKVLNRKAALTWTSVPVSFSPPSPVSFCLPTQCHAVSLSHTVCVCALSLIAQKLSDDYRNWGTPFVNFINELISAWRKTWTEARPYHWQSPPSERTHSYVLGAVGPGPAETGKVTWEGQSQRKNSWK